MQGPAWRDGGANMGHGFLLHHGEYTTIDVP
jgi:hypothetical protein